MNMDTLNSLNNEEFEETNFWFKKEVSN